MSIAPFRRSAVLTLLALAAACGTTDAESSATVESAAVQLGARDVAPVAMRSIVAGIPITGSLDPVQRFEIKARIEGLIDDIRVDRGSAVERGQVLATISAPAERAQALSAEAALGAAERDLRAADTLYKAGALAERDFVQARVGRDVARTELARAHEQLSHATVVSPIAGVVSKRSVEIGESVVKADALFTIVNTQSLELVGRIAPDAVAAVRAGNPVQVTVDAYSGRAISGTVTRIEPVAEPGTRQVAVYVRVPNRSGDLVAGLFATGVIMRGGSAAAVMTVPATAVLMVGNVSVVYVVDLGQIARREVTLGARDASQGVVEIVRGLTVGDNVLVNAADALPVGTRVKLAEAPVPVGGDTARTTGGR